MNLRSSLLVALLLAATACSSSTEPTPATTSNEPAVTAPGTPVGAPVTATIGAAGGSLRTADGRFELVVPPGALAADTQLSVQALTHTLPSGVGLSYAISPQNVTFAQPATVRLAPNNDDQAGVSDQQRLAMQDESGAWFDLRDAVVTPQAGTKSTTLKLAAEGGRIDSITAQLRNLNRGTRLMKSLGVYANLRLTPASASVRKGDSTTLGIAGCDPLPVPAAAPPGEENLAPVGCKGAPRNADALSASAGSLTQVAPGQLRYTAPSEIPTPNPVNVSATYNGVNGSSRVILLGAVKIIDAIERYEGDIKFNGELRSKSETVTFTASGKLVFVRKEAGTYQLDPALSTVTLETAKQVTISGNTCTLAAPTKNDPGTTSGSLNIDEPNHSYTFGGLVGFASGTGNCVSSTGSTSTKEFWVPFTFGTQNGFDIGSRPYTDISRLDGPAEHYIGDGSTQNRINQEFTFLGTGAK
ncbi:MAG: hypothetical protein HOO96_39855 [Polyangiaceae bacterium]|nr:hypothetical protein [Polyangiaceae bacterium]